MKVHYKRTGGITNIVRKVDVDSSELPENLQRVLNSIKPLELIESLHPDDFFHELELEDGRRIRCAESRCPSELIDLFDFLSKPHGL